MRFTDIDMDISTSGERGKLYEAVFRNVKTGNIFSRIHFGNPFKEYEEVDADDRWDVFRGDNRLKDPFDPFCLEMYVGYGFGSSLGRNEIIYKEEMGLARTWYCISANPEAELEARSEVVLGKRKKFA